MLWSINLLLVYLCAQIHSMWEEYLSGMYDYLGTEKCGVNYKDWSLNHNKTSSVGQFLSAHEGLTFSGKYLYPFTLKYIHTRYLFYCGCPVHEKELFYLYTYLQMFITLVTL